MIKIEIANRTFVISEGREEITSIPNAHVFAIDKNKLPAMDTIGLLLAIIQRSILSHPYPLSLTIKYSFSLLKSPFFY